MADVGLRDFSNHLAKTVNNSDFVFEQVHGAFHPETAAPILMFYFESMKYVFAIPVDLPTYFSFQPKFTRPDNFGKLPVYW